MSEKESTLKDRIASLMDTVIEKKLDAFEQKIGANIDAVLFVKGEEINKNLHKAFGLKDGEVVYKSDLIEFGRHYALEKSEPQKRTPATESPGPEGNVIESPVKKMFDAARKGEDLK